MKKIPLIAIVGPTAVGKTKLSIELAKKFNCEIISVDSVQIYKYFDVGSAKVTKEEMDGVVHHLIDELEPTDQCSVYDFQKLARKKIEEIYSKGKIPLLIGGTGFYMNAVLNNYKFSEIENKEEIDADYAREYLKKYDPKTYTTIDVSNERRVINAYNYIINEQKSIVENNDGSKIYEHYNPFIIVLNSDRNLLYERINHRVELMFTLGLEEEVITIVKNYGTNLQALGAIGYKEVLPYINEEVSKEMTVEKISQNSRRYAKRQLTWFRNKMQGTWYDVMEQNIFDKISRDVECFLKGENNENN